MSYTSKIAYNLAKTYSNKGKKDNWSEGMKNSMDKSSVPDKSHAYFNDYDEAMRKMRMASGMTMKEGGQKLNKGPGFKDSDYEIGDQKYHGKNKKDLEWERFIRNM